ncbi:MAG TPA: ADP-ribosyltransferase domain-containing protein, partial [Mucilaginibacter sp.]
YIEINELLRISRGKRYNKLGILLKGILDKLPNYTRFVYRGVNLTDNELQRYIDADKNGTILIEHSFLSTSKSRAITYFSDKKVKFTIRSKTGKDIEVYSKYGAYTSRNEQEVLFTPNCKFNVLEVRKNEEYTLIIMEEI